MSTQELPVVRIATPADEEDLLEMCRRLHAENGAFPLNEDKVLDAIRKCFKREGTIVGVIGDPGFLQASICMSISDYYYTDAIHLGELWNYVEPEYRKSRNAEALIEFAKECALRMNMPLITGVITNKQMAGKVRLYRKLLGYPAGAFFVFNLNWQTEPMEEFTELRDRLRDAAQQCNDSKVSTGVARKKIAPLLREAYEALAREDNIFGGSAKRGTAVTHANGT